MVWYGVPLRSTRNPTFFRVREGLLGPQCTGFSVGAAVQGAKPRSPGIFDVPQHRADQIRSDPHLNI